MSRPPRAKEGVLDAYERLLIEEGERAATLDATARAAGVSKGGLLYHFGSKEDLAAGLIQRLSDLVDADVQRMETAEEGVVAYYLRTSVAIDDPLDRALIATSRLAQGGHAAAAAALNDVRRRWSATISPRVRDEAALDLVMMLSDGLYFNNALGGDGGDRLVPDEERMRALIALVLKATGSAA
ncbi:MULTISPECIES: TetR/AcrR family transcriptional regulator [unclassified Microbacterium]|uniref:TetR/AcrR family transcriptional regulator n=1 Tax=unclassified Microbacterium TaxID=2609290 RepID=UPI0012FC06AF|nr:TetR/AcrR family transcriptional regulator [Microbacterium sp. MAH-37]MVQ42280.1 TetR family transcriptional regulator [Microbacterium sp. MAH-37]